MQIKRIAVEFKISGVLVEMNPIEYEEYISSYAQPNIEKCPVESGYVVGSKQGEVCPLEHWLKNKYPEQFAQAFQDGVDRLQRKEGNQQ